MIETYYQGRCPICSAQLKIGTSTVVCENGDYEALTTDFEGRWEEYERASTILMEVLLSDLQSYNRNEKKNDN